MTGWDEFEYRTEKCHRVITVRQRAIQQSRPSCYFYFHTYEYQKPGNVTMMKSWSGVCVGVLLAVLVSTTCGLQCYQCTNCGDSVGTPEDCGSSYGACMKLDMGGRIDKTCGKKMVCGFRSIEKSAVTFWNNIKNLLSDDDEAVSGDVEAKIMQCCDTDYCNTATTTSHLHPLLLLLVSTLVYLFQL
ncbi:hypothetical protein Pcinc_022344 [Petrolisthes cinctipes]|uniref:Uncharacterized protein n=1 Tax=Petrolisthes cinctipes TaxID=88211 RepID=A0AAE1FFR6_PETCI|nr:hypothetical protein Pcinc_022344 [Petrolisthes cinctipes]